MMRYSVWLLVATSSLVFSGCATQQPAPVRGPTIKERVKRLETRLSNQKNLLNFQTQLEQSQREIQQLRGEMEELQHKLARVKQQQRSSYLDVDQRLQQMSGGGRQNQTSDYAAPPPDYAPPAVTPSYQNVPATPLATAGGSQGAYNQALATLNAGRYKEAIQQFQTFLKQHPDDLLASNAQYWQAEAYYVMRNFSAARNGFKKVIDNYPGSSKTADALLKSGFINYEQSRWKQARQQLNQVVKQYPDSSAAHLAQQRLKKMSQERH